MEEPNACDPRNRRGAPARRTGRGKIAALVTLALGLSACGKESSQAAPASDGKEAPAASAEASPYRDVSVSELQTMLAAKDFPLINVHVPFEGDLPQTDVSIPYDHIAEHLDQLPADKGAKIVLYCRSGRMSVEAATTLAKLGYTNVYNLTGGFNAWKQAGFPMAGG